MRRVLIGLDIGTTTICGLVLDPGSADILSVVTRPNTSRLPGKAAWEVLQDPSVILRTVREITDGFLDRFDGVTGIGVAGIGATAIGVAGQMHGIVYVDKAGRACSPLYTWQDGRGDLAESGRPSTAARLSAALGSRVSTGMGIVTHAFNAAHGLVPPEAVFLCTISDYIAMALAGRTAPLLDTTNAASLGGFDLEQREFRRDDIEKLGLDARLFPEVAADYPVLGQVRPGVAVSTAAGDNQASFLGSVREIGTTVLFNVGTSGQVSLPLPTADDIPGIDIRPFPLGGFLAVGAALCGGTAYALLRGFFEQTVKLFTGTQGTISWEAMNAAGRAVSGNPLIVDTRFSGTRGDPSVRGSISGIGVDNFTPHNLITGVREGIAAELVDYYERVPAAHRTRITSVTGSGNALRLNPALRATFESRLGMPLRLPKHREETSFGAALLAGLSTGALPDLAAAGALVRYE